MMKSSASRRVELKTPGEIEIMSQGGKLLNEVIRLLGERIRPGVTTLHLDRIAHRLIQERGGYPAFLGYQGFPGSICASVNEEVVHGIPSDRVLVEGDIVSLDLGMVWEGFITDSAKTFAVGKVDAASTALIEATEGSLKTAISYMTAGRYMGDMAAAVQKYVESRGFSVVRDYAGHGVGRQLHEDPRIPNFGKTGTGFKWQVGMVVAIEPMVNAGTHKTKVLRDKWTVVTSDGKRSAHAEHTIAITERGPRILT